MVTSNKPNFEEAYYEVNKLLVTSTTIKTFPFSLIELIKEKSNIKCISFRKAIEHNYNPADSGTDSGIYVRQGFGKKIIFYNQNTSKNHQRYSLGHELMHYWLEHDLDSRDENIMARQEIEANFATAQLLMPEQIIKELQARLMPINEFFLMNTFQVSQEAARKRLVTLNKLQNYRRSKQEQEYDDIILYKYQSFIDKIRPANYSRSYFEDEYEKQKERDSWFQDRKRR